LIDRLFEDTDSQVFAGNDPGYDEHLWRFVIICALAHSQPAIAGVFSQPCLSGPNRIKPRFDKSLESG
jgi:hypothetical protein